MSRRPARQAHPHEKARVGAFGPKVLTIVIVRAEGQLAATYFPDVDQQSQADACQLPLLSATWHVDAALPQVVRNMIRSTLIFVGLVVNATFNLRGKWASLAFSGNSA